MKIVNFDEIATGRVNEWWRFGIIGWGILATLYVTSRGRQLFVKRQEQWTEINAVDEDGPAQDLLDDEGDDMKNEYMLWLKWIRQVRHRKRIITMTVITVMWLIALVLVSYGAATKHFVVHVTGSILALLMATFTAAHSVLWGGSCLSRILGLNARTCERGDMTNPTAPGEVDLCFKESASERTERKRERVREEIELMKKEILGEDMEDENNKRNKKFGDYLDARLCESKRNKKFGGYLDARLCESKC